MNVKTNSTDLSKRLPTKRILGAFGLVMINIIAIDNLRTLPFSAEYGFSLLTYYLVAMVLFFLPIAFVAAELATGWPSRGGIYVWVREALGQQWALFVIWLQWIYNVLWYPTILTFISGALSTLLDPSWAHSRAFHFFMVVGLFWLATFVNQYGMRISSWVSTVGAIIGTLVPMLGVVVLASIWLLQGSPIQISMSFAALKPQITSWGDFYFFIGIIFGLIGIEMSAVHADEVINPQKAYPRSILWSSGIIFLSLVLSSLAIAMVVPHGKLNVITGFVQGFDPYLAAFHLSFLKPVVVILIVIGSISSVATWIIGPSKGLLVAAQDGCIPAWLGKVNRHQVPVRILFIQAILVTILSGFFWVMPTIESVYLILTVVSTQLALIPYVILFISALVLRRQSGRKKDGYMIPGGWWGIGTLSVMGSLICLLVFILGFHPPPDLPFVHLSYFVFGSLSGVSVLCLPPWVLYRISRSTRA